MYEYLLVILEKGAVPFCHYSNPYYHSLAAPEFMPVEILDGIIGYARTNGISLNFLLGKHTLPAELEANIEQVSHAKMVPPGLVGKYPDGVLILDADDQESFSGLSDNSCRTVILRAGPSSLSNLSETVMSLRGKFKRLNLHPAGAEFFSPKHLELYRAQLNKLAAYLHKRYLEREEIEINVISDRMLLQQMNNCDAGVRHLTIAPNGSGYICPAFYYDDEADTIGFWPAAVAGRAKNHELLDLGHAPICSRCDAYHCKRCVYLNRVTTLEVNVPSREQCITAHAEREVSRRLLNSLRGRKPFDKFPLIPSLTYEDPFDPLVRETWNLEAEPAAAALPLEADDRLTEIYDMQQKILRKLGVE